MFGRGREVLCFSYWTSQFCFCFREMKKSITLNCTYLIKSDIFEKSHFTKCFLTKDGLVKSNHNLLNSLFRFLRSPWMFARVTKCTVTVLSWAHRCSFVCVQIIFKLLSMVILRTLRKSFVLPVLRSVWIWVIETFLLSVNCLCC